MIQTVSLVCEELLWANSCVCDTWVSALLDHTARWTSWYRDWDWSSEWAVGLNWKHVFGVLWWLSLHCLSLCSFGISSLSLTLTLIQEAKRIFANHVIDIFNKTISSLTKQTSDWWKIHHQRLFMLDRCGARSCQAQMISRLKSVLKTPEWWKKGKEGIQLFFKWLMMLSFILFYVCKQSTWKMTVFHFLNSFSLNSQQPSVAILVFSST